MAKNKSQASAEYTDAEIIEDDSPASTGNYAMEKQTAYERVQAKRMDQIRNGNEKDLIPDHLMPAGALIKKGVGKPSILTDALRENIIRAFAWCDTAREVCGIIGIKESSLSRWRKEDEEFDQAIEISKMTVKNIAKKKFIQGLTNGGFSEAMTALAILEPETYSPKTKLDITQRHTAEGSLADIIKKIQSGEIKGE